MGQGGASVGHEHGGVGLSIATARDVLGWIWAHPANKGRRARQIFHALRFQVSGRLLGRSMRTPLGQRSQLFASVGDTGASAVVYANPPDYDEMRFWSEFLRPGDLFVDVGANVGCYTIWACERGAEVVAIEPHPGFRAKLRSNLELNRYEATVVSEAIGSEAGTVAFTTNLGTTNHVMTKGVAKDVESFDVPVRTLDELLDRRQVRGIKVDVEGYERAVVEGAASLLAEHRIEVLQLEWNELSEDILGEDRGPLRSLLIGHGYELVRPLGAPVNSGYGSDVFAVSPAASTEVRRLLFPAPDRPSPWSR